MIFQSFAECIQLQKWQNSAFKNVRTTHCMITSKAKINIFLKKFTTLNSETVQKSQLFFRFWSIMKLFSIYKLNKEGCINSFQYRRSNNEVDCCFLDGKYLL